MSEVAAIEVPADPVLPVLSSSGAAAEIDAAPPKAPEAAASAGPAAERALPFEIEHAVGATRQAVLDHFLDSEGDQSMAQIKAALANMLPGTVEAAVRREWQQGRLLRISPGTYRLAPPPKPPEPRKRPSTPPPPTPDEETTWFVALEAWVVDRASWDVEKLGPPADARDHRIPPDIATRFADRLRKREERCRDREAALARQAEADAALHAKLIAGCFGNVMTGPGINDLAPIKAMLADGVTLEHVLIGLKRVTDRRLDPRAPPIASWREPRFLESVARSVLIGGLLPQLMATWAAAGTAPAKVVDRAEASPGTPGPCTAGKRTGGATDERERPF
jgi:hypothetical protein